MRLWPKYVDSNKFERYAEIFAILTFFALGMISTFFYLGPFGME